MKRRGILAAAVVVCTACDLQKTPAQPTPPAGANEVYYTAVGASDAVGYGGSVPCLPFTPCPTGTGYVPLIARRFETAGKTVTLMNLGLPGSVLSPGVQAIGSSIGRDIFGNFLDREMPFVPRNSTLVTVFAGGNDVNTIGAALEAGLGGTDPAGYVASETQNFGRDLRALMAGIKDRAPQARIVILNLPNMAALPYASSYSAAKRYWLQQIAVGFSAQVNALVLQGALVVDLMCDSTIYRSSSYSSDGFHPNDAGYAYLADLAYAVAAAGTATAPRAVCAQMTLF